MIAAKPHVAPPERGQLVFVRDRHWIVTNVSPSALAPNMADGRAAHLVRISSVDDDGLDDDIEVFWELETDAAIPQHATLPMPRSDRFDDPERLVAFLDAVRWGAVASADVRALQSPFRSGITIEEYQLDPVARALDMPRVNLLIADDVGLGKTIEAGLVVQEMLLRHRARSVMVLCPPALRVKWQREMQDRFGLEFEIIDAERVRRFRRERGVGENVFAHFPRVIVSFDWLKGERGMRLLRNTLPAERTAYPRRFDLLIVDEVHQCVPSGSGRYAVDSLRTTLLRELAPHVEHRLFLSATPHNGYENSYSALLEMLDPQRFARGVRPEPASLERAVIRRMKQQLARDLGPRPDGSPRFPLRMVRALRVRYDERERAVHRTLRDYAAEIKSEHRGNATSVSCDLTLLLLKKRLFSSPAAFARTLAVHEQTRRASATPPVGADTVRARFLDLDDDFDDDDELAAATETALSAAGRNLPAPSSAEQTRLAAMRSWAASAAGRPDAKAEVLLRALRRWCTPLRPDGTRSWNDERVVIFTEYRDTQKWLLQVLHDRGFGGSRLGVLYGGMDDDDRERLVSEFQADPALRPLRILLATDTASEGIDLQNHCRLMVHFEIPFNPNRLEQRNGRIDRHGQPAPEVRIYHFLSTGTDDRPGTFDGDLEFLSRVATKVDQIVADLGSAGAVLAVERAMLGEHVSLGADARKSVQRDALRVERSVRERVRALRERLDASIEELHIEPASVERVVRTGLDLARQPALERIGDDADGLWRVPDLTRSWAAATGALYDEIRGVRLPVTFDGAVAERRSDVVYAHLNNRLVAQSARLLRAEMWSRSADARLSRVAGVLVADADLGGPVILVHGRLVIAGPDGARLHEELITAGVRVSGGTLPRLNVGETKAATVARRRGELPLHLRAEVVDAWSRLAEVLEAALQSRGDERAKSLERQLADRADSEARALRETLTDLARSIREELGRVEYGDAEQLRLFESPTEAERRQLRRDIDALSARLDELPAEMERDEARLRARFSNPRSLVFPAAVEVLVPDRLGAGALFAKATR